MTLPDERLRAITKAREFLSDLLDPKKTPKVPKIIRERALSVLKHFPHDYHDLIFENQSLKKQLHKLHKLHSD